MTMFNWMTMFNHAPHGSNYHDHLCLCPGCNPQPPDEEVGQSPMWYCENEECGKCINDERYQCTGCAGWFCPSCSRSFRGSEFRVCTACLLVWGNLCRVQEMACCAVCGHVRENRDNLLCSACQALFG